MTTPSSRRRAPRARHPVPDAAPGLLRNHRALPGAPDAHDGDVPPTAQGRAGPGTGDGAQHLGGQRRARHHAGRAHPAARRVGGHAARPGAGRGRRRLGAVLRPHGLHHDAARQAGEPDRRGRHPDRRRTPAGRARLAYPLCPRARAAARRPAGAGRPDQQRHGVADPALPEQYLWGYNRYKVPRGAPPAPDSARQEPER